MVSKRNGKHKVGWKRARAENFRGCRVPGRKTSVDRNFHTRCRATTRSRVKVRRRAPQWCVTINLAGSRITGKRLQRAPTCASALFPRSRKEEREGEPSVRSLPWQRRTTSSRHAQQSDGAANPFPTTTTTGTFPEAIDRDTLQESPPAVKSITPTTTTTARIYGSPSSHCKTLSSTKSHVILFYGGRLQLG